ncbi:HdeD family acid-resistance protein [Anaerorudis cellulosivorans]|uniref:HdeD family acid-resistance protein n=1 Tax=Anaerorudis cellulosivorans TaxID=3397862 RepID=UPI002220E7D7|nr:HdeD family acid-resistance protein [Seramator thermalis]MCW1735871.1 HdeD family acid-resistance protein [Seramator thermalis]
MGNTIYKTIENAIKHWYLPLIVGVLLIVLGIWTLTTPLESYIMLSIVFAVGFFLSGIFEMIFAFSNKHKSWGWSFALGLLSIIIGLLMILNPAISMATLPFYVGFMLLFYSILGISSAYEMRQYGIMDWGWLMLVAVLALIFSFMMLWNPLFAGVSIVVWTGIAFIVTGFYMIYFSTRLIKLNNLWKKMKNEL